MLEQLQFSTKDYLAVGLLFTAIVILMAANLVAIKTDKKRTKVVTFSLLGIILIVTVAYFLIY